MMYVIACAFAALASFMICGIPSGLIFASRLSGVDVRKSGSGNIGMTNVARTAGGKAAGLTFAFDVGKGTVCMLLFRFLIALFCFGGDASLMERGAAYDWIPAVMYAACVFGHVFSPYLHFHGGKGISVGFGAALGLWWPVGAGLMAVFLLLVLPTRYISLGSVAAAISLPIQCALWGFSPVAVAPVVLVAVVVVWSHRENIGRLLRGEERRFAIKHGDKPKGSK
ncbi:MAG: glycerol-3-phosphate acyltransferase [Coriobacteriales bacterium]|nr:glycerol-3-phosphate acyltransferase [Coriobacteriales bacterium]